MTTNRFRDWYRSKPTRPLILAHRGDSFRAPENTLEAARIGLDSGADGWELDVRLTLDGLPVVIHDESLLRTTDVARRFEGDPRASTGFLVADFLLEEIRSLDAGSWFVDPSGGTRSATGFGTLDSLSGFDRTLFASGTVRIPTLAEALGLTLRLGKLVNVEIKAGTGDPTPVVRSVVQAIHDASCVEFTTVSSFDHAVIGLTASIEPGLATGALVDESFARSARDFLRSLGADALHAPPSVMGPSTVGVPLLVYTVNDVGPRGLAERLVDDGVAGLFTDDPTSLAVRMGLNPSSKRTRSR